jgi:formate dehydrogenase alpha subunit
MAVILVVEDDVDFHRMYKTCLEPLGHDVLLVETAEDALDLVERRPFDLAIIDLMLPGMDGAELIRKLRGRPETVDMPLIVFTSMPQRIGATFDESDRSWLPADVVVDKLRAESVLCAAVEKLLGRADARRAVSRAPGGNSLRHVQTTCPYCGTGCGMYLKVRRGRLVGIAPADGHPVSRGRLCVKGWTAFEPVNHPDRLKQPLIKRGGRLVPAGWDEALDLCAARFKRIIADKGPDALGVFGSARCTNEENYLAQKLARAVFGTNNVDHCARTCHSPTVAGLLRSFGSGAMTNSIEEIAGASCIFAIGANVTEAHPLIGWRVRRAKDRGAFLIVADPRRTDVAKWADIHLAHMPGTDLALLNAMANVIISEGLHDERFIRERTEGFEELREVVSRYTPETAAEICRVPAGLIRDAARAYARIKPASILYTLGITEHTVGTDNVMAVANLAMVAGNVGFPSSGVNPLRGQNNVQGACDMGALPNYYPGYQAVDDPSARAKFEGAWGAALPRKAGLTVTDMLIGAGRKEIAGLYIIGEDPVRSEPNVGLVERHLANLDFLVCQEIFLNETCKLADVVLPAAAFAEKDGTFTNSERRVQRVRKAVEPPGDAWPDWRIICAISGRMGKEMNYAHPSEIMDEIASVTPIYGGITYDRIDRVGLQWPCPDRAHPGTVFLHEGGFKRGKGRFYGLEHRPPAETPDGEYPLVLTTGRMLFHYNVGTMTRRTEILNREYPRNFAMINPDDARCLGVKNGRPVRVSTRRGSLVVAAEVTEDVRPGVIWMPFHFTETPTNRLTNDAFCPISRTGEYKACAAKVEPAETANTGARNV